MLNKNTLIALDSILCQHQFMLVLYEMYWCAEKFWKVTLLTSCFAYWLCHSCVPWLTVGLGVSFFFCTLWIVQKKKKNQTVIDTSEPFGPADKVSNHRKVFFVKIEMISNIIENFYLNLKTGSWFQFLRIVIDIHSSVDYSFIRLNFRMSTLEYECSLIKIKLMIIYII